MKLTDIIHYRLLNQQIAGTKYSTPGEIVQSMVAMQAQEFAMAKWAIGLRLPKSTDKQVEDAFNKGLILRTHLMRPTWHFITPMDIRWLLMLTAPRVHAGNATMYRKSGFSKTVLTRSNDIIAKALQGNNQLTRVELQVILAKAKIKADGIPLSLLMMNAELDGIICSGARKGKQFTYALLDERTPAAKKFHRDEAVKDLTMRYFSSRGPATLKDFITWSGLTMKDAREGVSNNSPEIVHENINGQDYFFSESDKKIKGSHQTTFLMPDYDEYGMSYKDRSIVFLPSNKVAMNKGGNADYQHLIIVNGKVAGTWSRVIKNNEISIETQTFNKLNKSSHQALDKAIRKYQLFSGNNK